jgi:hypothetical protein
LSFLEIGFGGLPLHPDFLTGCKGSFNGPDCADVFFDDAAEGEDVLLGLTVV